MGNLSKEQQDSVSQLISLRDSSLRGWLGEGGGGACDSAQTCVHDSSESLTILTVTFMYE